MDAIQFEDAVRRHQGLLYHIAYTMLRSPQDCADAVQEALMLAWRHRGSLRDEGAFRPWLSRILVNVCKSALRARKRLPTTDLGDAPDTAQADDQALHDAIQALPTDLRVPVVLFYLEGFSIRETANALRIPSGTVKSRLSRARGRLGALLVSEEGEA